jgi:predicted transcriptional regulator
VHIIRKRGCSFESRGDTKTKSITVRIQSLAEDLRAFVRVAHAIQRGHPPREMTDIISFGSLEAMRKVLTPKRLELLQAIRQERPASIYALAKTTGRDLRNVQDDVALLARLDLVSLSRGRHARAGVSPRVEYDQIRLDIPLTRVAAKDDKAFAKLAR